MPAQRTYPKASAADPVSPADLRPILDTHGIRLDSDPGISREEREIRRLHRLWVERQEIRPDTGYVMPLGVLLELLLASGSGRPNERGQRAWRGMSDAINDQHGGLRIVRRRFSRAA